MPCRRARIGRKAKGVQKAECATTSFSRPFCTPSSENRISVATASTISGSSRGRFTTVSETLRKRRFRPRMIAKAAIIAMLVAATMAMDATSSEVFSAPISAALFSAAPYHLSENCVQTPAIRFSLKE